MATIQQELIMDDIPEEIFVEELDQQSQSLDELDQQIEALAKLKQSLESIQKPDQSIQKPDQLMEKNNVKDNRKLFKSKVFRYMPLIMSDIFNGNKLVIKERDDKNQINPANGLKSILPIYNYDSKNEEIMILQTPFMDVNKKNIIYFHKINDEFGKDRKRHFEINFASQFFDSSVIDTLVEYENKVINYVKTVYGNDMKYHSKIIYNKKANKHNVDYEIVNRLDDIGNIRCKVYPDKKFKQYGKLISYNISKKYGFKEEFDLFNIEYSEMANTLDRILNDKKQMRLLLTPVTYLSPGTKRYVSYLKILMMEVKYKDAKIFSQLDRNGIDVKPEIIKISI